MRDRREFIRDLTLAGAAVATGAGAEAAAQKAQQPGTGSVTRPNIVLILADDMGYSDIGCYGSEIETPALDRLAAGGMRFSQFYNAPRCCPSRASLLTGVYSHQANMGMMVSDYGRYPFPAYEGDLNPQCVTIAEALKTNGYSTLMSGKWHLTPIAENAAMAGMSFDNHNWPLQRGFDHFYGVIAGAADYYDPATLVRDNQPIRETAADFYLTDGIADNAVAMMESEAKLGKPFFLYTAFNAPHWPLQAPEPIVAKYRARYARGWDQLRADRHAKQLRMGLLQSRWAMTQRDPRVPAWSRASYKQWEIERMAVYAAQIDIMDRGIGRMIAALERLGQLDNTLVLFMADNGGNYEEIGRMAPGTKRPVYMREHARSGAPLVPGNDPSFMPGPGTTFQSYGGPWGNASNTPFRMYKHFAHEGGISSPLVAHWPGGIRGRGTITHQLGHEIDIMATCLEVSGTAYPAQSKAHTTPPPLEGRSLLPVFRGGSVSNRGMLFWEHEGNCAVRDGKWKLVSAWPETWELYDMDTDRTELHNLADTYPEQVVRLGTAYRTWAARVGAQPWPMPQTPPGERGGTLPLPDYLKTDRT
ncbi:MAG: arylsulfatase [Janthinobacterium lividum]